MKKSICKCRHSKYWHDEEGCHHENQYTTYTTSGVIGLPMSKVDICDCKKFEDQEVVKVDNQSV